MKNAMKLRDQIKQHCKCDTRIDASMRRRIGAGNKSLKKLVEKKIITSARTKKKIETKPAPNADPTIGL